MCIIEIHRESIYMSQSLTIKMQLDAAYISRNNYYVIILHQEAWLLFRLFVAGKILSMTFSFSS